MYCGSPRIWGNGKSCGPSSSCNSCPIGSWSVSRVTNMGHSKSTFPFECTRPQRWTLCISFVLCALPFRDPALHHSPTTAQPWPPWCGVVVVCVCVCVCACVRAFIAVCRDPLLSHTHIDVSPLSPLFFFHAVFHNAKKYDQPLGDWDVSRVTDMRYSE